MSLLQPEGLNVFVAPGGLLGVRWRGWRRRIVAKRAYAARNGADPWRSLGDALNLAFVEPGCRSARLLVSDRLVRYRVLPWRDDLRNDDEAIALARLAFADTFGHAAESWEIRLSDEPPGRPRVAAALPQEFLGALRSAGLGARLRSLSIRPYLVSAVDRWRRHFGRDRTAWGVFHDDEQLSLALIERGRWRSIRQMRAGKDWAERLPELVERESVLAGVETQVAEALVFAPRHPGLAFKAQTRIPFRVLRCEPRPGFSPEVDAAFGLALAA